MLFVGCETGSDTSVDDLARDPEGAVVRPVRRQPQLEPAGLIAAAILEPAVGAHRVCTAAHGHHGKSTPWTWSHRQLFALRWVRLFGGSLVHLR